MWIVVQSEYRIILLQEEAMADKNTNKTLMLVAIIAVIAIIGYIVYDQSQKESMTISTPAGDITVEEN